MDLAKYSDYRDLLRQEMLRRKQTFPQRYTFQKMAEECRVQKTYLSRVLKMQGHLSSDQTFLACGYLGFDEPAVNFTLLLKEFNDCLVAERKQLLQKKLLAAAQRELATAGHLSARAAAEKESTEQLYFLDPWNQIIHLAMEIPRFAKNPALLLPILHIEAEALNEILEWLETQGFLVREGSLWRSQQVHLHLSAESTMQRSYRKLMRMAALHRWEVSQNKSDYGFSVLFTADEKTLQVIRKDILAVIKAAEKKVVQAKAEKLIQMNIDLLGWL